MIAARTPGLERAAPLVVNTILGSTLLFEFIGPLMTKLALSRADEPGEGAGGAASSS